MIGLAEHATKTLAAKSSRLAQAVQLRDAAIELVQANGKRRKGATSTWYRLTVGHFEGEILSILYSTFNVGEADSEKGGMCVMDEDGTTRRLDIKTDVYDLLRLMDDFEECDDLAKIDTNKLALTADPMPEQIGFPGPIERQEAIKILRMLTLGMRSLWHPVIRAIADHATMTSLGQGKGKGVAAAVGRQRVIEGLRIAESIRKGLKRQDRHFSMWQHQIRARQIRVPSAEWRLSNRYRLGSVDDIITGTLAILPIPVRAPEGHYLNQAAGPVIKLADKPLPANDNHRIEDVASIAA
jgi:hypothetical protein